MSVSFFWWRQMVRGHKWESSESQVGPVSSRQDIKDSRSHHSSVNVSVRLITFTGRCDSAEALTDDLVIFNRQQRDERALTS